jgi:hypothetical protein
MRIAFRALCLLRSRLSARRLPIWSGLSSSGTFASDGTATYRFKLGRNDLTGTYGVTANANVNKSAFGSATTTFSVN